MSSNGGGDASDGDGLTPQEIEALEGAARAAEQAAVAAAVDAAVDVDVAAGVSWLSARTTHLALAPRRPLQLTRSGPPASTATVAQRLTVLNSGVGDQAGGGIAYITDAATFGDTLSNPPRVFQPYEWYARGPIVNTSSIPGGSHIGQDRLSGSNGTFQGGQMNAIQLLFARFFYNTDWPAQHVNLVLTDLSNGGGWTTTNGVTTSAYNGYAAGSNPNTGATAFVFAAPSPCKVASATGLSWQLVVSGATASGGGTSTPSLKVIDNSLLAAGNSLASSVVGANATAGTAGWNAATAGTLASLTAWVAQWNSGAPIPLAPANATAPTLQFLGSVSMGPQSESGTIAAGVVDMKPILAQLARDWWEIIIIYDCENAVGGDFRMGFELQLVESSAANKYDANANGNTLVDWCDYTGGRARYAAVRSSPGVFPYGQITYDATANNNNGSFLPVPFG